MTAALKLKTELLKHTAHGAEYRMTYEDVPANPSGIRPVEFKVVVLPKPVEEVTAGGIHLPPVKVDTDKFATQEATIVAMADNAFSEAEIWGGNPPKVGDVVLFAKYAGLLRKGKDGKDYRVLNDKDVCAVLE